MTADPFQDIAPIREWTGVNRDRFESEIQPLGAPAVMRGLVADWPLVKAARSGPDVIVDALKAEGADVPVRPFRLPHSAGGRFFYSPDFKGVNFDLVEMTLGALLDQLLALQSEAEPDTLYAGAVPVRDALAPLAERHPMPLLDDGMERLTSLWVGNQSRTAPHWDLPQNFACVLSGRRRFLLFPIEEIANLYIGPLDFTLAGQPVSLVDPRAPDPDHFPRFADAIAKAQTVILEPGDVLYMPSLQIHYVESLDPVGLMMNVWWRDGPVHLATPFLTLLHGLTTLRGMPARERAAWKVLFDRYLFQDAEDPMAHLPDEARGVFGEATPERLARIRALLVRSLGR